MDKTTNPDYYGEPLMQPVDYIRAHGLNFELGNVIKCITRAGKKVTTSKKDDLKKALWYLQRELKLLNNMESMRCSCSEIFTKVKLVRKNGVVPHKATKGSAAYDCCVADITTHPDGTVTCYLGFATEIPDTHYAEMFARSSISKSNYVLANGVGIIDSDYRGEWKAIFKPLKEDVKFPYTVGDRVCQVVFKEKTQNNFIHVSALNETERGSGGFGSTGR